MTTRDDLELLVDILNRRLRSHGWSGFLAIGYAYGRPRLEAENGSIDVSPRAPKPELETFLRGMLTATDLIEARQTCPHPDCGGFLLRGEHFPAGYTAHAAAYEQATR